MNRSNKNSGIKHKGLIPAPKALELVLEGAEPIGPEAIRLDQAANRVLAEDLKARRTQPPFAASAMDGYAVKHSDLSSPQVTLTQTGESAAGSAYDGPLPDGSCIRIFTGAPVPDEADTVIIQENTLCDGNQIRFLKTADKGANIRDAGSDFKTGQILLEKNTELNAEALCLAAAMDHAELPVWKKPKIAVLATGDELVLPGEEPGPGQIIASNTFGLTAIAEAAGGDCQNLGIAKDTIDDHLALLTRAVESGADLIVTTGGASVGDHDLVKPAVEKLGFEFEFVKIAIRPGKPVMFAKAVIDGRQRRFLGLPGNPVSSLVTAHMFMRPLIRKLAGYSANSLKHVPAILAEPLRENGDREDYMRATLTKDENGQLRVTAFKRQDSSMLSTMAKSDCLLIRPIGAPAAKPGDSVPVVLLHDV